MHASRTARRDSYVVAAAAGAPAAPVTAPATAPATAAPTAARCLADGRVASHTPRESALPSPCNMSSCGPLSVSSVSERTLLVCTPGTRMGGRHVASVCHGTCCVAHVAWCTLRTMPCPWCMQACACACACACRMWCGARRASGVSQSTRGTATRPG
eukprot:scaffold47115_cov75-Phaeocystis_antarctica.AAC.1